MNNPKKIDFKLVNPTKLTPVSGTTNVTIDSDGKVLVEVLNKSNYVPRDPHITLAATDRGSLSMSPKGVYTHLNVILPTSKASQAEFYRQVGRLFELYHMGAEC